ncbi:MAG: hypothetical protein HQM16_10605 [Deltaproteobacteria bacterium]|nr:hypothetical protein [Deltaproteobacteria bacterium]
MKGINIAKKQIRMDFKPIGVKERTDILGITIKKDESNKVVTFLCQLSAYTENAQFNDGPFKSHPLTKVTSERT